MPFELSKRDFSTVLSGQFGKQSEIAWRAITTDACPMFFSLITGRPHKNGLDLKYHFVVFIFKIILLPQFKGEKSMDRKEFGKILPEIGKRAL